MRLPRRRKLIAAGLATASAGAWLAGVPTPAHAEPAEFVLDPEHTSITFFVHHVGYADLAGMFLEAEGPFVYGEETQELSELEVAIDTASVFTNHEERDRHLRGADFLDVEEHPKMTFVGTATERLRAGLPASSLCSA